MRSNYHCFIGWVLRLRSTREITCFSFFSWVSLIHIFVVFMWSCTEGEMLGASHKWRSAPVSHWFLNQALAMHHRCRLHFGDFLPPGCDEEAFLHVASALNDSPTHFHMIQVYKIHFLNIENHFPSVTQLYCRKPEKSMSEEINLH